MSSCVLLYSFGVVFRGAILIGVKRFFCVVLFENIDIAGERGSDELLSPSKYHAPTDLDAVLRIVSLVNLACWGFVADAKYKLVDRVPDGD